MANLGTWRGACEAELHVAATPANRHVAWVTTTVGSPEPTGDQTTWEGDAGTTLTVRFKWHVGGTGSGTGAATAPNFATIEMHLPGGGIVGTAWNPTFPAADTEVTNTFTFSDSPFGAGNAASGMVEIYLIWGHTGGATPWSVDSRGATTGTILGTDAVNNARGALRARVVLSTHSISNASLGGAQPSKFAYPDPIFVRDTFSAKFQQAVTITQSLRQGGNQKRSNATSFSTGNLDSSFNTAATQFNADFATPNTAFDSRIVLGTEASNDPFTTTGDNQYAWKATGQPAGWVVTTTSQLDRASDATGDSGLTLVSPTRTTSLDVVNFGLGDTVGATFNIQNSRAENLLTTSGAAGSATANVLSRDTGTGNDEGTLASAITPSAGGVYTVTALAYSGPTTNAGRGTGPNGDTAGHRAAGLDKGIHPVLTQTAAPSVPASARLWALSDLLRLDVHPEKSATLNQDTNPYASPGDGEDANYVISADILHIFAFVGGCRSVNDTSQSVGACTTTRTLFDVNSNQQANDTATTQASGTNKGWTTGSLNFNAAAPSGNWRGRITVDAGASGAGGNYGDSHAATANGAQTFPLSTFNVTHIPGTIGWPTTGTFVVAGVTGTVTYTGISGDSFTGCTGGSGTCGASAAVTEAGLPAGSLEQAIGFTSAYTADRTVLIQVPDEVFPGEVLDVRAAYINYDATQLIVDALPQIRIFQVKSDGTNLVEVDFTNMVQIDTNPAPGGHWKYTWTVSSTANGTYDVEIRFIISGGKVSGVEQTVVRPKYALRIGPLTDRMSSLTGSN